MRSGSLLAASLVLVAPAPAQETDVHLQPLRALPAIRVVVESLHPSITEVGLAAADFQAMMVGRARAMRLRLASGPDSLDAPWLYLRVTTRPAPDSGYFSLVELSLHDWVTLVRDPSITVWASVWRASGAAGYADPSDVARRVREAVGQVLEDFAQAHARANSPSRR